jgi:diphosphomevalonate decarboxylase
VRALREEGEPVFFTIDAGPQLKAICQPGASDRVASALAEVPGVIEIVRCGLGDGARVVEG